MEMPKSAIAKRKVFVIDDIEDSNKLNALELLLNDDWNIISTQRISRLSRGLWVNNGAIIYILEKTETVK